MDVLTFIVDMTKALVWPVSVAVLAVTFRPQFIGLLERLKHFQTPGVEVDFSDKLDEVEARLPKEPQFATRATPSASLQVDDGLPADMLIINAWRQLEDRLRTLAVTRKLVPSTPSIVNIRAIYSNLSLQKDISRSIEELRSLRNQVAHQGAHPESKAPTKTDALRYVDLVADVLQALPET